MFVDKLNRLGVVLVLVLLVAFLALYVLLDGWFRFLPTRQIKLLVDVLRDGKGVFLYVLETHFIEPSFRQALFLLFVGMIELHVVAQDVLLHFFVGDGVELQWFIVLR